MSYIPTNWKTGDVVTSEKLNHIEDGIANSESVLVVGGVSVREGSITGTLDKTWQEIHDALESNICIVTISDGDSYYQSRITAARALDAEYDVVLSDIGDTASFSSASKDGYPSCGK